ncbi:MAG: nucleotidyl transferase AbiEii/AbiGii toxin family protein [Actinomycetota bacterium]|nr:nucleotidyl transferase AbiEii/AbiGii toxin family protein [Actinomycetota bacterium]MDQ2956520.1 nucleotidyl transferase AbiEii/AbiGii toxin family protein [Actinomycetota bacterium]
MTFPSGLNRDEAAAIADEFGVAPEQIHRDHLISLILAALEAHVDDLTFFGGTALARTYLPDGRLSEDIDLIARTDRRTLAVAIRRTIDRALRVTHGRVEWTAALEDIHDTDPTSLVTADGLIVRVQLLSAQGYPPWPSDLHDIHQRYSDVRPTRLRTPVRDSFAGWKTAAWFDRHAPRDLYDLWALAAAGALTPSAAQLFATHAGVGPPQDHMFMTAPTVDDWQAQLSGQTRLMVGPEEALRIVRSAWAAARY